MKIRKLTPENYPKTSALLHRAFSPGRYEVQLFEKLHEKGRVMYDWVCIHRDTITAYIAFTNAYDGTQVCGLHLAPVAVNPQLQGQGIGSELVRFALRQDVIRDHPIFVLGNPKFYQKFGFEPCSLPVCPFARNNANFLSIRNSTSRRYTVGYEPEFRIKG
jgi:putative acetyltransferase